VLVQVAPLRRRLVIYTTTTGLRRCWASIDSGCLSGALLEPAVERVSLCSSLLKVSGLLRDEVVAVLGLLETTESHLGSGNVLLGVLEVGELRE
jgi:hypothetical protein